ncbi:MAG: SUMF1/EgtB/PvdO family nonheme iron enzyme [bacterium]
MKVLSILLTVFLLMVSGCSDIWNNANAPSGIPDGLIPKGTNDKGYREYINEKDSTVLVYIPSGSFIMGSDDEYNDNKLHTVYLDGYYISKYETNNKQYKQFCDATGRDYPQDPGFDNMNNYFSAYPDYPVVNVTWEDANAYCEWAGLKLPTEAQWAKGARGTDGRKYPWGDHDAHYNGSYYANCHSGDNDADGYRYASPVGSYENGQSPYGLMDMTCNVYEWCADWYDSDYYSWSPDSNPMGPEEGTHRVIRGASWDTEPEECSVRFAYGIIGYCEDLGFRPALY